MMTFGGLFSLRFEGAGVVDEGFLGYLLVSVASSGCPAVYFQPDRVHYIYCDLCLTEDLL